MPFIAGEAWTVGGAGSFYGNNLHCNPYNDYYATDWNRAGDGGATVLPIAHGQVVVAECLTHRPSYGCNIRINHLVSRTGDYYWNSTLTVHNLNPGGVTFNAQLYDDAGVLVNWLSNVPLGPRASHTFSLNGTARGSVRVMSADYTKPIVAVVRHENAGADTIAYVGATEGGAGNFAASLFKDYWGWNSSSSTQETYDVATTVNAYYSPSGSESFNLNLAGGREIYLGASQVFPTGQGRADIWPAATAG